MSNKNEQPLLELVAAAGDSALEVAIEGAVAIFGPAVVGLRAVQNFREKVLAQKIEQFISEPALRRSAQALNLRNGMFRNVAEMNRVGNVMILVLDKVTDLEKPTLLGQVMAAYLDDEIDAPTALRLTHAIDISSTLDLQTFLNGNGSMLDDGTLWPQRLAGVGLVATYSSGAIGGGDLDYGLSPLGSSLLRVVEYCAIASH